MKNNINFSPEALRDLDEIWEYISVELENRGAASKTVNRILDAVEQLKDFGELGSPLSAVTAVENDYRFLVVGSYMIFYRCGDQQVYIDRVLYGRRDYLRILFHDELGEIE